jgi:DNA-binding transcriptional ArsR family regulator
MISIASTNELDVWLPALADPTRRTIVEMLGRRAHTATEIHRSFPIAAPAVSRHLRVLRESGLIAERAVEADRRVRLYELRPESIAELSQWLAQLGNIRGWNEGLA